MFELTPPRETPSCPADHAALAKLPALAHALAQSPYLTRLCRTRPETLAAIAEHGGAVVAEAIIDAILTIPAETSEADLMRALRHAKADIHLTLASLDLSCTWSWNEVTHTFSRFADAAIAAALNGAVARAAERGWVTWDDRSGPLPGLFLMALGKLGAFELNYSSDVDLVAMYDSDRFPASGGMAPSDAARRIIQHMSQILETNTEHGYVLRVDLRLRPDPRSTPVAVSTQSAEIYYESRGQNWERMAYIKARLSAGDPQSSAEFLDMMTPFVWRRHLDFWALEDIRGIKQQIHAHGGHLDLTEAEFDVKLGQGGIREIEFFAQTQQLIHGGRNPDLRSTRTIDTLAALCVAGHIDAATQSALTEAYALLRGIEHRIQMLNDEHTHTLSGRDEIRDRVAALCGYSSLDVFDAEVRNLRERVNGHFAELFSGEPELPGISGNLVFTGVDEDPGTVRTLAGLGFSNPSSIISDFQSWHRGGIRATRSPRGRHLLSSMERRLFQLMQETGNPDAAYEGLKTFMGGLSAGVQTLSLLAANPAILADIISIFSVAPRMARDLANRPALLEAMLDGGFLAPLSEDTSGYFDAIARVPDDYRDDIEGAMNEVRRQFRDAHFRIRYKLLHNPSVAEETGPAFTHLADVCIRSLEPVAVQQAARSLGPPPGRWAICGLGKLGSNDLTADSDLDLLVIYDPDDGGSAAQFFTRATQRLITALSAQTEEGLLYETDMQLRPSGRAGPVAVRLSAFSEYYSGEAWTWEHMALTRLRPIAGDPALCAAVMAEKQRLLSRPLDPDKVRADAWDMRQRLLRDRPAKNDFDLKLVQGGMMDVEFITQTLQLIHPDKDWGERVPADVLNRARAEGILDAGTAERLTEHYRAMSVLLAFQRVALSGPTPAGDWPTVLQQRATEALNMPDFTAVCERIDQGRAACWNFVLTFLQPAATE